MSLRWTDTSRAVGSPVTRRSPGGALPTSVASASAWGYLLLDPKALRKCRSRGWRGSHRVPRFVLHCTLSRPSAGRVTFVLKIGEPVGVEYPLSNGFFFIRAGHPPLKPCGTTDHDCTIKQSGRSNLRVGLFGLCDGARSRFPLRGAAAWAGRRRWRGRGMSSATRRRSDKREFGLSVKEPKRADLSEYALKLQDFPRPSKLMTRVRFPSPAPASLP
jgi:hypothetical protein